MLFVCEYQYIVFKKYLQKSKNDKMIQNEMVFQEEKKPLNQSTEKTKAHQSNEISTVHKPFESELFYIRWVMEQY